MRTFRWEDIDHSLVSLRRTDLAEEMFDRMKKEEARIYFENRLNLNACAIPALILEMKTKYADEYARRVYEIYDDIWKKQGHVTCAAFVRAVCSQAVVPTLRARADAIAAEFSMFALRTNFSPSTRDAMLSKFERDMERLQARWERRLEAEAKECEHRERKHLQVPAEPGSSYTANVFSDASTTVAKAFQGSPSNFIGPHGVNSDKSASIPQADMWRSFHIIFQALADEELTREPHNNNDRWMRAYVSCEDQSNRGLHCVLSNGIDEGFKARFEVAATRAGIALDSAISGEPLQDWLDHVYQDLCSHRSNLLFAATRDDGGIITRICEASAISCARLEKNALQFRNRDRAAVPPLRLPPSTRLGKPGRALARTADFVDFAGKLWIDAKRQSTHRKVNEEALRQIASSLDKQRYVPPAKYLESGCARELKAFNSRHSNSKTGPIRTWCQLVDMGDKDHLRGMRRLLSRCAMQKALL
jgi:hypothetical protein